MKSGKLVKLLQKLNYIYVIRKRLHIDYIETGVFGGHSQRNLSFSTSLVGTLFSDLYFNRPNQYPISFISYNMYYFDFMFYRARRKIDNYGRGELVVFRKNQIYYLGYIMDLLFAYSSNIWNKYAVIEVIPQENGIIIPQSIDQVPEFIAIELSFLISKVVVNSLDNNFMFITEFDDLPL